MFTFILVIHVIVSLILILVVLSQSGKGAELGAAFGSVGQANSVRTPETFLTKFTTFLAVIFILTSISLALLSSVKSNSSVVDIDQTEIQRIEKTVPEATAAPDSAPTENENPPSGTETPKSEN